MMRAIRARVGTATGLSVLVLAIFASVSWYLIAAAVLRAELDTRVDTSLRSLATLTRWKTNHIELEFSDELMPYYLPGDSPAYYQMWAGDRSVLERSESLGTADLPLGPGNNSDGIAWDQMLPDGRAGRAMMLLFPVTEGFDESSEGPFPQAAIAVMHSREALDKNLSSLRASILVVGIALALLGGLAAYLAAYLGLRSVNWMARQVDAIDPALLPDAIEGRPLPSELHSIRNGLNALISRIRETVAREQRVASSIAHELRTPISELMSVTEVALRWPDDGEFRDRALQSSHGIAVRMHTISDSVLRLAQAESAAEFARSESVELESLIQDVWTSSRSAQGEWVEAAQPALLDLKSGIVVQSDPAALQIILGNLFDNALTYNSDRNRPIRCSLTREGDDAVLRISNEASNVTAEDVAHFNERFWRKDRARTSGDRPHLGLGLTLVAELCRKLAIALRHTLSSGELETSLRFRVRAPHKQANPVRDTSNR